jgi:hypothetical protein
MSLLLLCLQSGGDGPSLSSLISVLDQQADGSACMPINGRCSAAASLRVACTVTNTTVCSFGTQSIIYLGLNFSTSKHPLVIL